MIKKIKVLIKLDLMAGKATPAPPLGSILGQHGINITAFCNEYNLKTKEYYGTIIPAKITIYEDKTYSFVLKTTPVSKLLLNILNLNKGSNQPNKTFIGEISLNQLKELIKIKIIDLNTKNIDKALLIIKGTAKNMGIKIIN